MRPSCIPENFEPVKFSYVFNVVACIMSMTYHASFSDFEKWLIHALRRFDLQRPSSVEIVH